MKLATWKQGGRDGTLVVVSRDLSMCQTVREIVPTLQAALDDWARCASELEEVSLALNNGHARHAQAFDPRACHSPLPRAYQWADGSAYVNHVELVRRARGAEMPASFWTDPVMYQGGSDGFLGPCDAIVAGSEDWGIDLEGEVAVITGDVPMDANEAQCASAIRLLMLVNDVSLRNLIPNELAKGFGFFQSKPASAFSPVAVTPDELGDSWDGERVPRPLTVHVRGVHFGAPLCGEDMVFGFPRLVAHAAKTRALAAGSIVGSGTISNYERSRGSACIAERRTLEQIEHGAPRTPYLALGDRVRIEMFDATGASVFGAIDQSVEIVPAVQ